MTITTLETVRLEAFANPMWRRAHIDEGLRGLGETVFAPATLEAYRHEIVAPKALGRDPLAIDRLAKDLTGYLGFRSTASRRAAWLARRIRKIAAMAETRRLFKSTVRISTQS